MLSITFFLVVLLVLMRKDEKERLWINHHEKGTASELFHSGHIYPYHFVYKFGCHMFIQMHNTSKQHQCNRTFEINIVYYHWTGVKVG